MSTDKEIEDMIEAKRLLDANVSDKPPPYLWYDGRTFINGLEVFADPDDEFTEFKREYACEPAKKPLNITPNGGL